ncbi:MAG TPA: hypothetical protein VKR06_46685 [Ktedonosporobacter sp.]|nr:hypothetical protein [Ktedonosporobacter sp.]
MKASKRFALYTMNLLVGLIGGACLANNPTALAIAITLAAALMLVGFLL